MVKGSLMEHRKLETYDGRGNLLSVDDTRTVASSKADRLKMVRQKAKEGIEALGLGWMVEREISGGKKIPKAVKAAAAKLRAESNDKEAQIKTFALAARDDDDKTACDKIETV